MVVPVVAAEVDVSVVASVVVAGVDVSVVAAEFDTSVADESAGVAEESSAAKTDDCMIKPTAAMSVTNIFFMIYFLICRCL